METQIHLLEQEAYCAVLRAFKAQSDAITWEKESLITELRKELRVSDDEHRELLNKVQNDDIIRRIRDWRQGGGAQVARNVPAQSIDVLPSPTFSASRKKQKTFQSYPSIGSTGNRSFNNRVVSGAILANEPAESLIGRKVWTKWPEDNNFYEAVITQYNADEGRHALVYDINTASETWEWVDLKEIPPEDIRWDGEETRATFNIGHGSGPIRGSRRSLSHSGGRGRVPAKTQPRREQHLPSQNGSGRMLSDDIELFNTDALVKEVERVVDTTHPDPLELEKAKKMLKEHEQALIAAIARLAETSDGESGNKHKWTSFLSHCHEPSIQLETMDRADIIISCGQIVGQLHACKMTQYDKLIHCITYFTNLHKGTPTHLPGQYIIVITRKSFLFINDGP